MQYKSTTLRRVEESAWDGFVADVGFTRSVDLASIKPVVLVLDVGLGLVVLVPATCDITILPLMG